MCKGKTQFLIFKNYAICLKSKQIYIQLNVKFLRFDKNIIFFVNLKIV
jgi:hypothetical protein